MEQSKKPTTPPPNTNHSRFTNNPLLSPIPSNQRKVPQNSTNRSHKIPFLQQNPHHNPENLPRDLPTLHHQGPPRLPKEGQQHHDGNPRDDHRRNHNHESRHHGEEAKDGAEKHGGVERRPGGGGGANLKIVPGKRGLEEVP